jgi:hypothetical protein
VIGLFQLTVGNLLCLSRTGAQDEIVDYRMQSLGRVRIAEIVKSQSKGRGKMRRDLPFVLSECAPSRAGYA